MGADEGRWGWWCRWWRGSEQSPSRYDGVKEWGDIIITLIIIIIIMQATKEPRESSWLKPEPIVGWPQFQEAASLRVANAVDNQGQVWSNLARWNKRKKNGGKKTGRNSKIFKRNWKENMNRSTRRRLKREIFKNAIAYSRSLIH